MSDERLSRGLLGLRGRSPRTVWERDRSRSTPASSSTHTSPHEQPFALRARVRDHPPSVSGA
eukprot:scaffold300_cov144-Isochrysis_galbana.AAC.5